VYFTSSTLPLRLVFGFFVGQCVHAGDVVDFIKQQQLLGHTYQSGCKDPQGTFTDETGDQQPCDGGLDCSGLVQYSFAQAASVPACPYSLYKDASSPIDAALKCGTTGLPPGAGQQSFSPLIALITGTSLSEMIASNTLRRGDLLFFFDNNAEPGAQPGIPTHVGIYEGGDLMIDAYSDVLNNSAGGGIREDNLLKATLLNPAIPKGDPNYWQNTFLFGGRVKPPTPPTQVTEIIKKFTHNPVSNFLFTGNSLLCDATVSVCYASASPPGGYPYNVFNFSTTTTLYAGTTYTIVFDTNYIINGGSGDGNCCGVSQITLKGVTSTF
jgi:cell wall-associated NlpC family hydrolase